MQYPWLKQYPKYAPADFDLNKLPASIADCLERSCKKHSDAPALTCMDATLTFAQLDRLADRFASFLVNDLKLQKGDRIAIMLPNVLQFPIAFFAAQKAGLVCVNTNPLYTPREMLHQFSDSGAKAIVILDLFTDKLEKIIKQTQIKSVITTSLGDQLPTLKGFLIQTVLKIKKMIPKHHLKVHTFKQALALGAAKSFAKPKISPHDLAILQYTGGTTGVAKGAMLTQQNIVANMEQVKYWTAELLREEDQAKFLTALPLYHIFALTVNFLSFLSLGCHMILVPKPVPIKNTVKMFKKYNLIGLTGVNTLFNAMNNEPLFQKIAPQNLKIALAGGMALQQSVSKAWQKITGIPITEGYGLTEASPVTHCNPLFQHVPEGSIGLPLPGTLAKIVDDDGNDLPLASEGELVIKGPQVMKGYWNKPEETAKVLRDGWLRTGDIATIDENGFFYIVDRKKDMILVSGFNVYPNEIEEVLAHHPKVLEVAVIGVNDDQSGESVKAFIVKKDPSLTEAELKEYCATQLTNYKRPKHYEFRKELPKSNIGKILRKDLRTG